MITLYGIGANFGLPAARPYVAGVAHTKAAWTPLAAARETMAA